MLALTISRDAQTCLGTLPSEQFLQIVRKVFVLLDDSVLTTASNGSFTMSSIRPCV